MKKLKIAMFGHKRIPSREGGVEIVVEQLSTKMVKCGMQVTCFNRGGRFMYSGKKEQLKSYQGIIIKKVPTIDIRGVAAVSASFFAALCSAVGPYDVIHIHAEGPAFFCWIPKLFHKKVVVTIHGLDWMREKWQGGLGSKFIKKGEEHAVKYADDVIVLSKNMQQYFYDKYHRKTHFIPNGVERPEIKAANQINKMYGLEKNQYILFLGRLVPEKGLMYLINSFKNVNTKHKLVIAGGSSDTDEYMAEVKKAAMNDSRICFTGFVQGDILQELYSNAYVYVLPSDVEGMPLSLLEAMSYGNCCLVSDIKEITEVVGNRAVIFQKGNVIMLTEKLQYLCDSEKEVNRYKLQAADFICEKYNWDFVANETLSVYLK